VKMVTVVYIRRLILNRSCTYMIGCAVGRLYVVKPWEKGNVHGLQLDVMVQLCDAGSDIVYYGF
jgi:hypothetical protein